MAKADSTPKSGKFKRKLTPFLCKEMLYDYAVNRLDVERRQAVEEFLKGDDECRRLLEGIRVALEYAERLAEAKVKPEVVQHLSEAESAISMGRRYSSWKRWPDAIRWSVTAVLISTLFAGMIALIPWKNFPVLRSMMASVLKVKRPEVIEIAQLTRPDEEHGETAPDQQDIEAVDEGSGDEEMEVAGERELALPPNAGALAPSPVVSPPPPLPLAAVIQVPSQGPIVVPTPGPSASPAKAEPEETQEPTPSPTAREAKAKGFVYRAYMTLANLDELGTTIADSIIELGGEKAGEVELGWKRGTGRYYHFALPEENHDKLLEKLRAYGPVRISKDPHPRVMPDGQVRFILWIEAAEQ